jgi:septum formation protein
MGYEFTCANADIDESIKHNENPYDYVERLAIQKAQAVAQINESSAVVLGSDTSVVFEQHILGKPKDQQDCYRMLSMLSGKTHQVYTSIAAVSRQQVVSQVVMTNVEFTVLTEQEILTYWHTGEPQDKAGAYGIQGIAGQFVKTINGSYSAVVGLPLFETTQILQQCGVLSPLQIGVSK